MPSGNRRESNDGYQLKWEDGLTASLSPEPAPATSFDADVPAAAVAVQAVPSRYWYIERIQDLVSELSVRWFETSARIALFVIYFWFGFLKVIGLSPASPLASALVAHTIGLQYFSASFKMTGVFECAIALMFLVPRLTWIASAAIVVHLVIVSSPLVLVGNVAWVHPLVPTLEGQYIIKDLALLALAIGILAHRRLAAR
jgi:uncharacterized membrane protein YkgB